MLIFNSKFNLEYKTFITQEMLKKGFLAGTAIYSTVSHTKEILNRYFHELEKVFKLIQSCEDGRNIYDILNYPTAHSTFERLN